MKLKSKLTRRSVLKGIGVTIALPWLEQMVPLQLNGMERSGNQIDRESPLRMAAFFMPNGVHPEHWTPSGEGKGFQLSRTLSPLESLKDQLSVFTNLWNRGSNIGDGHYTKTSGFLTCTPINKTLGIDLNCNGISIDQLIAKHIGHLTPLPSLELGIEPVTTGVDRNVGFTRVYGSHIAWKGPTTPLAKEIDPRMAYQRIFRAANPSSAVADQDRHLLNLVLEDAKALNKSLGKADRKRLEEYLESISDLERRMERLEKKGQSVWKPRITLESPDRWFKTQSDSSEPVDHDEHVKLMLDILAIAFQSDVTRVGTFMFGNSVSNRNFAYLDGVNASHHHLSHHENKQEKLEQYRIINQWHVEMYSYFLSKLDSMKEGDKSVLDNSMILFGSGIRDGNRHDPHNLPILLAGKGGGKIQSGHHVTYSKDTPLSNLYLAMLQSYGIKTDRFADSIEPLKEVLIT